MRLTWPLIGRSRQLRAIEAALADPAYAGVVVSGTSGVGKSRVVREALDAARSRGFVVRWIVGTSTARALPLGALAPWAGAAHTDGLALLRGVVAALTESPPAHDVVLGVDDAPLLDELSTLVVHQVIQQRSAKVVLTVRDTDPIPPATTELWKVGEFTRLVVEPLDEADTADLVTETVRGPVDAVTVRRLWSLTRGNPLYLRTIVEHELAAGRLARHDGAWRWTGDPVVPPGLVEAVDSRMAGLPAAVHDVVDVVAVGEPLDLRALTHITAADAVEIADVRGLIVLEPVADGYVVRLAHPLYGEVRRARAAPTRLRRFRGLVATALAESPDRDDMRVTVRRATLSLDSDLAPDVGLLLDGARNAAWLLDLPLADRLADAAIRAGGGAESHLIRGFVLSWLGEGDHAEAVLAAAAHDAADGQRSRLAFMRAVNVMFTLGDPGAAKILAESALGHATPAERILLDAFLGVYWAALGDPVAALRHLSTATTGRLPDGVEARLAAWAVSVAHGESGRVTAAAAAAESAYSIPARAFVIVSDAHVDALLLAGRIADAAVVADLARRRAGVTTGAPFGQIVDAVGGLAALGAGRLDDACASLQAAVTDVTRWNAVIGFRYRYQVLLATASAMRGRVAEAMAALRLLEGHRHPGWRHLDYTLAIAQAWAMGNRGAVSKAIDITRSAARSVCGQGRFAAEVMCLQTATQFGDASTARRLRELDGVVEGPRVGLAARFAEALAARDAAELLEVSLGFETMGDLVAATDAAAHSAIAFRRNDLRGSSLAAATRAEALAARCGGARTPALRQAIDRLPLTSREREIVTLLGESLSNREIADLLVISVRTVESHVYKAMTKTGVSNRDDLAALLSANTFDDH